MKRLVLILFVLVFSSCGTVLKVVEEKKQISEKVEYSIDKIEYRGSMAEGGMRYFPEKGFKFAVLRILINNYSNTKADLNFKDFYLLDVNSKIKYSPESIYTTGLVWLPAQIKSDIKKDSRKKRNLVYVIPLDMDVKYTMIGGKMDVIKFK